MSLKMIINSLLSGGLNSLGYPMVNSRQWVKRGVMFIHQMKRDIPWGVSLEKSILEIVMQHDDDLFLSFRFCLTSCDVMMIIIIGYTTLFSFILSDTRSLFIKRSFTTPVIISSHGLMDIIILTCGEMTKKMRKHYWRVSCATYDNVMWGIMWKDFISWSNTHSDQGCRTWLHQLKSVESYEHISSSQTSSSTSWSLNWLNKSRI